MPPSPTNRKQDSAAGLTPGMLGCDCLLEFSAGKDVDNLVFFPLRWHPLLKFFRLNFKKDIFRWQASLLDSALLDVWLFQLPSSKAGCGVISDPLISFLERNFPSFRNPMVGQDRIQLRVLVRMSSGNEV